MDAIYSCAALTIAAGSGSSAESGLPGVSIARSVEQISERVDGLRFAVPFPNYVEIHDDPSLAWNTRRWTLQEKLLSKRLLLFTDQQVYFKCSNAIWCEDTILQLGALSRDKRRRLDPFRWVSDRTIPKAPNMLDQIFYNFRSGRLSDVDQELGFLPNYMCLIEEYTGRTLTNPSDAVKAIQGILNTFNAVEFAGIPRKYLKSAILWQPVAGSIATVLPKSRTSAPSWSWAAWTLPEGCTWYERDYRETTCSTQLKDPAPKPRKSFDFSTMYIFVRQRDAPPVIKEKKYGSKYEDLPQPNWPPNLVRHLYQVDHILCFHTLFFRFFIGEKLKLYSRNGMNMDHVELFEITDALDNTVGEIWISGKEAFRGGRQPKDFILLSFGTGFERATVPQLYVPQRTEYVQDDTHVNYGQPNNGSSNLLYNVSNLQKGNPQNDLLAPAAPNLRPSSASGLSKYTTSPSTQPAPKRPVQVNVPPEEWVVGNMMLIELEQGIARRVALGKVIKTALEKNKWKDSWIHLA